MNKSQLIEAIAEKAGISKVKAGRAIDAFMDSVGQALQNGEEVVLLGFGTFSVADRAERQGRHPQTGKPMKIPASRQPKFKAGKNLKDMVK